MAACGTSSSGSGATGGSGGAIIDSGGSDGPISCGSITEQANLVPAHLYVMLDKSSSMAGNQWAQAVSGLSAFAKDPASAGLWVALNYFPREPDAVPACDQKAYSTPVVPFGLLPKNATPIISSLTNESPNGLSTPTYPALGGALLGSIKEVQSNPGHNAAVLLVTDGVPQGPAPLCGGVDPESFAEIEKLAKTGKDFSPSIVTYVIGLPGVDQSFADQIAQAGGSGKAIVVSAKNVEQEFQTALEQIRGKAVPCEFVIPSQVGQGEIGFDKVNVQLTKSGSQPETILQTKDCTAASGWHYDDPQNPKKIFLCPDVCQSLKKDFGAKIDILLGCKTQVVK